MIFKRGRKSTAKKKTCARAPEELEVKFERAITERKADVRFWNLRFDHQDTDESIVQIWKKKSV